MNRTKVCEINSGFLDSGLDFDQMNKLHTCYDFDFIMRKNESVNPLQSFLAKNTHNF